MKIIKPNQNEMKEVEKLFNLNDFDSLKIKVKNLIAIYPNYYNLYNILGVVYQKKGNFDEAILNFKKSININPNFDQAYNNLGNVLHKVHKSNEAIKNYHKAIEINPNYAIAYTNLGNTLADLEKFDEALINQKKAVKLEPNNPDFRINLGTSLKNLGEFEQSMYSYEKAVNLNPNYAEGYSNLGAALTELGRFKEALAKYKKALELNPNYKKAHLNEAFVRLNLKEFKIGWNKYEFRLGEGGDTPMRYEISKIWDGNYLNGTLLVWGEQGLGDHIMFSSMLKDLTKYSKKVILEIDNRLENLFSRYFEKEKLINIKVIKQGEERKFDKHIPIGSLGQYLRKSEKSFKTSPKKYLQPSPSREGELKDKFFNNKKFKVGVAWKTLNKTQKFRNIDLKKMLPIFSNPNCDFINLQFGKFDQESEDLKLKYSTNIKSINEVDNYSDIDGLAALINCLDLVITIENTTMHLSAALGKNTWVMLSKNSRWHWFGDKEKSLWYPSMKIFKQEKIGNWDSVINNISEQLKYN
jgi:Flp pilus assembly protein TadD